MKSMNTLLLLGDGEAWARQRVDFANVPEMVRTVLQVAAGAAVYPGHAPPRPVGRRTLGRADRGAVRPAFVS